MSDNKKHKNGFILIVFVFIGLFAIFFGLFISNTNNGLIDKYVDVNVNSMMEELYENTKIIDVEPDKTIYNKKRMTVDKMSDSYKANIAYSKYSSKIKITPEGNSIVDEKSVKYAYDSVFGEGTYKEGQDLYNGCKNNFKYNKEKNIY